MKRIFLYLLATIIICVNTIFNFNLVFADSTNVNKFKDISASLNHTIALKSDGTVWSWGSYGKKDKRNSIAPIQIMGISNVKALSAGPSADIFLIEDGTVWIYENEEPAILFDGDKWHYYEYKYQPIPKKVDGLNNVVAITAGGNYYLALKSDGTVFSWGNNSVGQLGDGTLERREKPVKVMELFCIKAIAAGGEHNIALKEDGTVWTWGNNRDGELGNYDGYDPHKVYQNLKSPIPKKVKGIDNVKEVDAGRFHTVVVKNDGTVWSWGWNQHGQLGEGDESESCTPAEVSGVKDIIGIAAGEYHTVAIKNDGTIYSWGLNRDGQLGINSLEMTSKKPQIVIGMSNTKAIGAGESHTIALKQDGSMFAWGDNEVGQIGDGTISNKRTPVQVENLKSIMSISAGGAHSTALDSEGKLWTWGWNDSGQLLSNELPMNSFPKVVLDNNDIKKVYSGASETNILYKDGTLQIWGNNYYFRNFNNIFESRMNPFNVKELKDVVDIACGSRHSLALRKDGTVWAWGQNFDDELGMDIKIATSLPVQIAGISDVVAISAGDRHSVALKRDGTVWTWGSNFEWQLGYGWDKEKTTPVKVEGLIDVVAITAGYEHTVVLKKDGSVWAWGHNNEGQLGYKTYEDKYKTPQKVDGLSDIVSVSAGYYFTAALKKDGTVWYWGYDNEEEINSGGIVEDEKLTPKKITGIQDITSICCGGFHLLAIRNDGTVWGFGRNDKGQLGMRDTNRLLPTKVKSSNIVLGIGNPRMIVNGSEKEVDAGNGTTPVIINGRTFLPIRAIIDELGGNIDWNSIEKKVVVRLNNKRIDLIINNDIAFIDGKRVPIGATPMIINGRTMLPIRFIAENLDCYVGWNSENSTIILNY